jgi:hypothetical protein
MMPMSILYHSEDLQCCSLTMLIGTPLLLKVTAFSIFRPKLDCFQLSVAYSPMTKKEVDIDNPPSSPPLSTTACRHSRRAPYLNVPVKQNLLPSMSMCGGGVQSGSAVARSASPVSKSGDTNFLRSWKRSSRSSSSTQPSSRTVASLCSINPTTELLVIPSFATSQRCIKSISWSERKSSAITPRAMPTSSVTCLSSNRSRLKRLFWVIFAMSYSSRNISDQIFATLACWNGKFNDKLIEGTGA